ncbi:hypothetical protein ACZ90_67325, partial [Streptomyces albus subsp. albus]
VESCERWALTLATGMSGVAAAADGVGAPAAWAAGAPAPRATARATAARAAGDLRRVERFGLIHGLRIPLGTDGTCGGSPAAR